MFSNRNIAVYLSCEGILSAFGGFILPIYVLYFRVYDITLFEIAILAAVFEASVLLFEIPTGLLADRFGRKLSVNIGFVLFSISGMIFIVYRDFTGFLLAEILFGLAEAFISGAGEALAVDSIKNENRDEVIKRLFSNRGRVRIAITSVAMIAAGYFYSQNISITFYPVLLGGLAGLGLSSLYKSQGRGQFENPGFAEPLRQLFIHIRKPGFIKITFVTAIIANFAFEGVDQFWQVLASESANIDTSYFGIITAAGAILAFILIGPVTKKHTANISSLLNILLLAGLIIYFMPLAPALILAAMITLFFVIKEIVASLFSVSINISIGSIGRATFLSGFNMACSTGEVFSGILIGFIASKLGLEGVFMICGAVLIFFVLPSIAKLYISRKEQKNH
ncbi:MAG: MFS transporter [candidate division Zixibacteria bacterium]